MIEREYLKLNTSIQTGSNANQLNTDEQGNVEAKIELRLPDNLFDNNAFSRKIESVDMLTTKFRLSMENTPIAEFPLDIERSTERDPVTTCQLSVYPFCLLDNGVIKPDIASGNLSGISFPYYKSHKINYEITFTTLAGIEFTFLFPTNPEVKELDYQPNYPFYEVLKGNGIFKQMKHIFNMCPQSNHEDFNVEGSKLSLRNMGTIVQMLQDSLENAISYASISSEITATIALNEVEPPAGIYDSFLRGNYVVSTFTYTQPAANLQDTSLRNCVKPTVELGSDSISISYDSVPFTGNVPFIWNPRYIETWDKPVQFTESTTLGSEWMPPPAKRICQYGVKSSEDGYNFTLPDQSKTAVMNIIANRATRDTLSFLPWIEVDRSLLPTYTPIMHDRLYYTSTKTPKHTYDTVPVLGNVAKTADIVISDGYIPFTVNSTYLTEFNDQEEIASIMGKFVSDLHYSTSTKFYLLIYAIPRKLVDGEYIDDPDKTNCYMGVYAYIPEATPSTTEHGYVEYNVAHTEGTKVDDTIEYTSPSIEFPSLDGGSSSIPTGDTSPKPTTLSPELSESGETSLSGETSYLWYSKNAEAPPVSLSGGRAMYDGDDGPRELYSDIRSYVANANNHLVRLPGDHLPVLTRNPVKYTYNYDCTIKYNGEDCHARIVFTPFKFTSRWDSVEEASIKTLTPSEDIRSLTLKTYNEDYESWTMTFVDSTTSGLDTGMEYMYQPNFTTNDDEKFYIIDGTTAEVDIGSSSVVKSEANLDLYEKVSYTGYYQGTKSVEGDVVSTYVSACPYRLGYSGSVANSKLINITPTSSPHPTRKYFTELLTFPGIADGTIVTYGSDTYIASYTLPTISGDHSWAVMKFKNKVNTITLENIHEYFLQDVPKASVGIEWNFGGDLTSTIAGGYDGKSYYFSSSFSTAEDHLFYEYDTSSSENMFCDYMKKEYVYLPHNTGSSSVVTTPFYSPSPTRTSVNYENGGIVNDRGEISIITFKIPSTTTLLLAKYPRELFSKSTFATMETFTYFPFDSFPTNDSIHLSVSTDKDSSDYYYYILAIPFKEMYRSKENGYHVVTSDIPPGETRGYINKNETVAYKRIKSNVDEDLSNVPLSFTWRNIPMVVLSPISSIVMTLQGMECTQEIQPINVVDTTNRSSAITSTVPIIENYYSLAQSLRDLHDELVVTRESFDDGAKYSLTPRSGQERTIKLAAKYIGKDGKLHQIYIPPNGVFSVQLTFALSYFSA